MEIKIGVSARHVHLTDEDFKILFGEGCSLTKAKDLTQMDLIISIDESDVADIKKDLDVSFTVDAYSNRTFKGKHCKICSKNS